MPTVAQMRQRGYQPITPPGPRKRIWAQAGGVPLNPVYRDEVTGAITKHDGGIPDQRSHAVAELLDVVEDLVALIVAAGVRIPPAELLRVRNRLKHIPGAHDPGQLAAGR